MKSENLSVRSQQLITDFLRTNYPDRENFVWDVASKDEMFYKAIVPGYASSDVAYMAYVQSGKRMLDVLRQIVDFSHFGLKNVRSVLEFACGYGRFTRHLVQDVDPRFICVSDIYTHAVDWQTETFGVRGVYSTDDPARFSLDSSFDVIFVGSLFSHLPNHLFKGWLRKLYGMLNPGGVLAFSVHDVHLNTDAQNQGSKDFQYAAFSESDTLSTDVYGMAYVSGAYVARTIQEATDGEVREYAHVKKGLYENQDLYVLSRGDSLHWHEFDLRVTPLGGLEGWGRENSTGLFASGCGISLDSKRRLDEVTVFADDRQVADASPIDTDVSDILRFFPGVGLAPIRWRVQLPTACVRPDSVVKCRLTVDGSAPFDVYVP